MANLDVDGSRSKFINEVFVLVAQKEVAVKKYVGGFRTSERGVFNRSTINASALTRSGYRVEGSASLLESADRARRRRGLRATARSPPLLDTRSILLSPIRWALTRTRR